PKLRHRLISAVQLNRPDADLAGMSTELVGVVTREAEGQVRELDFPGVADHGRLRRALKFLVPVVVLALVPLLLWPGVSRALVERHLRADVEIPRQVPLEPVRVAQVQPAAEKVTPAFRVTAENLDPDTVGTVYVTPEGQPRDRYPLRFDRQESPNIAIYTAD